MFIARDIAGQRRGKGDPRNDPPYAEGRVRSRVRDLRRARTRGRDGVVKIDCDIIICAARARENRDARTNVTTE